MVAPPVVLKLRTPHPANLAESLHTLSQALCVDVRLDLEPLAIDTSHSQRLFEGQCCNRDGTVLVGTHTLGAEHGHNPRHQPACMTMLLCCTLDIASRHSLHSALMIGHNTCLSVQGDMAALCYRFACNIPPRWPM